MSKSDAPESPLKMPFGFPITAAEVHEVWDVFVKPTQDDDAPPQSSEVLTLMAILRWTHKRLSVGPCPGCKEAQ